MKIAGQYSKRFSCDKLSSSKEKELTDLAVLIRRMRNEVSKIINSDLFHFYKLGKYGVQKELLPLIKDRISSHFTIKLMDDVSVAYSNKFNQINRKMTFKQVDYLEVKYYETDYKKHKKGDFDRIISHKKDSPISKTLTYLSKFGDDKIITWLPELLEKEENASKRKFYKCVISCIDKFGLERLMETAISRRNRILKRYSQVPIEFKSLTFHGRSRLKGPILSYNTDFDSIIKAFVTVSWMEYGDVLSVPVKYSKSFHGNMKQYQNGKDTTYTVHFDAEGNISIVLYFKGERDLPDNKKNFVGVDVNTKHNLLQCSNGSSIDFDRRTMSRLSSELKWTDELEKADKDYVIGKRKNRTINHLRREIRSKNNHSTSNLCKELKSQGYNHVVFENLNHGFGNSYSKTPDDINQNRLMSELHLSSLKNEFDHVARKYDIATSYVHSEYTSQTCSKCGCVDRDNRESQEIFKCIECGYECNADVNASVNICDRVALTVLRDGLLDEVIKGSGVYEPKELERSEVKELLLSRRKRPASMDRLDKDTAYESDLRF